MRVGTMVSLGASAVLGIGALLVAKVWLPAQTPQTQVTAQAAQVQQQQGVPVVVASRAIAYGSKLEPGSLTVVRVPASAVPEGAFTTVAQVIEQPGGAPVALQQIAPREPVLATSLSGPGARPNLAATIGEGMRAYTIGVSDVLGGGGHILPGDRVDVVLTRELEIPGEGGGRRFLSSVVTQNVRVLGMDLNADPASVRAAVAHTATLEISLEDSVRLALASRAGTLSLALRRTGEASLVALRPVSLENPGSGAGRSAERNAAPPAPPAPPNPSMRVSRPSDGPRRTMTVTQGGNRATVEVPADRSGI